MLPDLLRFNQLCTRMAQAGAEQALMQPLGDFLKEHRFGDAFRDWYFLPMLGCIWSCPTDQMLKLPGGNDDPLLPQPRPDPGGQPAPVVDGDRRRPQLRAKRFWPACPTSD